MERKRFKKGDVIRVWQKKGLIGHEHRNSPFVVVRDMGIYIETEDCILNKADWQIEKEKK